MCRCPPFLQTRRFYLDHPDPATGEYYTSYRVFPDPDRDKRRQERDLVAGKLAGRDVVQMARKDPELRASAEFAECDIVSRIEARQFGRQVINSEKRGREESKLLENIESGKLDLDSVLDNIEAVLRACKEKERALTQMLSEKRRDEEEERRRRILEPEVSGTGSSGAWP